MASSSLTISAPGTYLVHMLASAELKHGGALSSFVAPYIAVRLVDGGGTVLVAATVATEFAGTSATHMPGTAGATKKLVVGGSPVTLKMQAYRHGSTLSWSVSNIASGDYGMTYWGYTKIG